MHHIRDHTAYPSVLLMLLTGMVLVLAFLIVKMWHTTGYDSPGTTDLVAYWTAGQLLRAGESPYDFNQQYHLQLELGSHDAVATRIWNPPWLLIWIFPLFLLAFPVAAVLWLVVNVGLILACGTLVWRTLAGPSAANRIGIAWLATIAFVPVLFTLRMGQISTIVLVGVVGFLYFASRDRGFLAGMCLALTTIKPHVVYALWIAVAWWVIAERRWKTVAGAASLLLGSIGVLILMWPASVSGYQSVLRQPPVDFATPTAGVILQLLLGSGGPGIQYLPSFAVGLAVLGYLLIRRPALNWKTAMGPLLVISVATAPYGWSFDYIVLLVPYIQMVIWVTEDHALVAKQKMTVVVSLLVIAALMVAQNLINPYDLFFFWVPWAVGVVYVYTQVRHSSKPDIPTGLPVFNEGA